MASVRRHTARLLQCGNMFGARRFSGPGAVGGLPRAVADWRRPESGRLSNVMTKTARALIAALLLSVAAAGCSEEEPAGDLRGELAELRDRIAEAKETAERHQGGLVGEMAAMRREALLLSAALLENRLIAEEGGVPAKLVAPATSPDPARAHQILRHIAAAEERLEHAKKQAETNESVAGSLAQTTVVTQELALAQLWLAYYQSDYGLALPGRDERKDTRALEVAAGSGAPAPADPARIVEDLGALKDSARAEGAENSSAAEPPATKPALKAAAQDVGAPIDTAKSSIAEAPAAKPAAAEAAQEIGAPVDSAENGGAAPLATETTPEEDAQHVTALIDSVKVGGPTNPKKEKETEPASAPQPPPRHYSREDTVRLQLLLQEAGFNPGTVDGRWGPSTQGAIAEFQRASGLPASGQPDAATLDALGSN